METLQLNGGVIPETEEQFWLELAAALNLEPKSKVPSRVAQAVLKELAVEWDDEFIDEQDVLTLTLYETLDDAVKRFVAAREAGNSIEEEEDDASLAGPIDLNVQTSDPPLGYVYQMIRDGILILSPDWQRNFVWTSKKMKRFVESILLGLPIPSFLLFWDSATGKKYVIDGRQRLETIYRFKAKHVRGEPRLRFKTFPRTEPGWRPGEQLSDAAGKYYDNLDQRFQTIFDSAPLQIAEFKDIPLANLYQVFKRYNTGAVALNAAEIRNAVYQASPLHKMLFRLAGEQSAQHLDDEEKRVGDDLRQPMGNKKGRYGAYDFIGRYFAFAYQENGSVAKATLDFMDSFNKANSERIEELRKEFITVFKTAQLWYAGRFLTDPDGERFHAFMGTLQLVSTKFLLERINAGLVSSDKVKSLISTEWNAFAQNRLAKKQNSTLFWGSQKTWVSLLESRLELPRKYTAWDWKADLDTSEDRVVR
ncbi:MAG TPA: DUF262 domain-containing protein [Candidatus Binatia bacterium]